MFNYEDVLKPHSGKTKIIEQKNLKLEKNEFRIVTEQARYPLVNLNEIFQTHILQPKYQRTEVWDIKRKSKLIESFLINIPVPPVFLYETEYSIYEVMDGQQRISTILSFFNNKFNLEGLEYFTEYNGKYYKELPDEIQKSIGRRYLSATILLKETARNKEEEGLMKQLVFERLNTGGIELNKQEIRNALYPSNFNDLLFELAKNKKFKMMWKLKTESTLRMEDCELILRFFAYKSAVKHNVSKSTKDILDTYMRIATSFKEEEITELKQLFEKTVDLTYNLFGKDAFKSSAANNKREKMIYDTVMLLVSENLNFSIEELKYNQLKYEIINKNKDVFNGKYTAIRNIKERLELMEKIFKKEV